MNKVKKNNVVNFPGKISDAEREVEAIIFAAAEPLSIETIESKISNSCVFSCAPLCSLKSKSVLENLLYE